MAGGSGLRLGGDKPKQYQYINGKTIIELAALKFVNHKAIQHVVIVANASYYDTALSICNKMGHCSVTEGGNTRQESVLKGLEYLKKYTPENVLIHDAARPMVTEGVINTVLESLKTHSAVAPVIKVPDTARFEGKIINREALALVQTPQGFRYVEILAAHHASLGKNLTDDLQIIEELGGNITFVQGDTANIKITTKEDLERARKVMGEKTFRVGNGFDAHRFAPPFTDDNHIMLAGVAVPFRMRLEGHSDADVGLHALTDALLGAVAEGDIGTHFPPRDPRWKGMDSSVFLEHAAAIIAGKGGRICNIDLTFICEEPKVSPYREAMREKIAAILKIGAGCVSVKATTTEGMGFTGRQEGIAASAVALIEFSG